MRDLVRGWRVAVALAAMSCATVAQAAGDDDVVSHLKQTFQERFPSIKIDVIQPAPMPGIYEVIAGSQVSYSDSTGNYLIVGRLMDTRTRHDLSAEHVDAQRAIDFHSLPFDKAIKIVKGNGKRQLAIFADPDCPYCRQLEKDMGSMTDLTVYLFLYPLESLHPNATVHAHAIWCSPNRSLAWTDWMLDRKDPPAGSCDSDPIKDLLTLGSAMHIDSTPTLFLESGRRIGGAVSANELQKLLDPVAVADAVKSSEVPKRTADAHSREATGTVE